MRLFITQPTVHIKLNNFQEIEYEVNIYFE